LRVTPTVATLCFISLIDESPFGSGFSLDTYFLWDSLLPRFLNEDYMVQVHINDYLDIFCPHYEVEVPEGRTEEFTLYMVGYDEYVGCYDTPQAFKRWECNKPFAPYGPIRFSEKIQRFTPFSLGVEFRPGNDYYYV
uniref:Si:dkey-246i14.3 n=1 Tax=Latimeria chalumnae TaxID=7897 RepID=H3AXQ8_LATCH